MKNYILETKGLSKKSSNTYRVKDLALQVPKNSVYGFLGPNGAGKSTALKLILGLINPDEGDIHIFGEKLTSSNKLQLLRKTGSLIENPGGYPHLTGLENMQIIQRLKGADPKEIEYSLKSVNLFTQKDKKLGEYSLGMKQRLVIAMYFLSQAKCWLMDEVTNGLDEYYRQKFFDRLAQIDRKEQLVLLSSHYKEELVEICDSMVTIRQGQIEEVPL